MTDDETRRAAYLDAQEVILKALGWFRTRLACHKMVARQQQYPQTMIDEVLALEVRLAEMLDTHTPKE